MQSSGWMNGQYRQVGPPSQSSQAADQFTHNTMSRQQNGTAVQPPQRALFTYRNGAYPNGQPSNWQTSALPHQDVSSFLFTRMLQHSSTNTQCGTPSSLYGFQQDFHHQNSSTQSPPNVMVANAAYSQQNMSAQWNQSPGVYGNHLIRIQNGNVVPDLQHPGDQNGLFNSVNGESTATSCPHQKGVHMGKVPVAAQSTQTAHNHNQRPNGYAPSTPLPSFESACQSFRGTNSLSSGQHLPDFNMSQNTPQYSTHNSGGQAASFCSNSHSRQYETNPEFPSHPAAGTKEKMHSQQIIARIAEDLRSSFPAASDAHPPAYTNSPYRGKQFVSRTKSNQNKQPSTTTVTESYPSQLAQLLQTQSSVANSCQRLEKLSSAAANDSSIHLSPGRTRAVAVVQPLSHERYQVSQQTCNESDDANLSSQKNGPAVHVKAGSNLEGPNQNKSNESAAQDTQKRLSPDDTGSELQVDPHVAPPAQQFVTSDGPVSQSEDEGKSNAPKKANPVFELSSLPATPLTRGTLTKLIEVAEKELNDYTKSNSTNDLLSMFWDGNCTKLACQLRTGWYRNLMRHVLEFCQEHVRPDSVILSYIKRRKKLKSYHVLQHNELYSELPYKSVWLNVDKQLDDIDKEFGLPQALKPWLHTLESASQLDQVETEESNQTSQKELDSSEEKLDSAVEATLTQAASLDTMESVDATDPCYSFQIQVLSPKKAKVIFEQIQSKLPQSVDNQPESITISSVDDELPEVIFAPLSDTELENESACPIQQVCCIPRWKQMIWGSDTGSLSKCQCENKQSHYITKENMEVQGKDNQRVISSDSKFNCGTEEGDQVEEGQNVNSQVITLHWPDLCDELGYTIDFSEDDDKPHSNSDKEPQNISQISINSSDSSIILLSENEDDLSNSKDDIPDPKPDCESDAERAPELTESSQSSCSDKKENNPFLKSDTEIQPDPEVDCAQDQLKSWSVQSCNSDISGSSEGEVASKMSDLKENTTVTESSMENKEEQSQINTTDALQNSRSGEHETVPRKRKRSSSQDGFFPIFKKSKKCKSRADGEFSPSKCRTVELVLYGSRPQNKTGSGSKPPKVITVQLSPLNTMSSETAPPGKHTVKQSLHDTRSTSFTPMKIRRKSKVKTTCTFSSIFGRGLKKAKTPGPAKTHQLQVSETRIRHGNPKTSLSLKRRLSLSDRPRRGEERTKKDTVTLGRPAKQKRSEAENGGRRVPPLHIKSVLKFSVLPNTFNFKDGSNGTMETTDPAPDMADLGKKSPNRTVTSARGAWFPDPEKKCCASTKSDGLFSEFQKKYTERTQLSMDG
ncbi:uncharacterized protein si:ch211-106e7.2 isoform X2 [Etheostoma cragini]|uniref:uncharacterized protein si:ch211-106e7.2 isoform X2 n=1 Tax=Etheostoma cragini TaxID=417921 RepID=UPI00155EB0D8|nr:uncharacterized protein si:ch211-106e7.2 isoform X2 [Etheostoma cragini]